MAITISPRKCLQVSIKTMGIAPCPTNTQSAHDPHPSQTIYVTLVSSVILIPGLRTLPYRSILQKLGLKTLEHRRLIHDLCLCRKILHEFIHCTIPKFPVFMSSRTRGRTLRLRQEKAPSPTGSIPSSIAW